MQNFTFYSPKHQYRVLFLAAGMAGRVAVGKGGGLGGRGLSAVAPRQRTSVAIETQPLHELIQHHRPYEWIMKSHYIWV